ncbi:MAG TPA: addiction module protein [Chitinophagaceae bacterium]|jgi:hypothetical protein
MSYNIKELLVLPAEDKIMLADLLYSSANEELEDNKNREWWKDEEFVNELNKGYEDWKQGKVKGFTIDEVKAFMREQKANTGTNEPGIILHPRAKKELLEAWIRYEEKQFGLGDRF